ncbi:hypothetical protein ACFWCH_05405 [Microbacterium sp. NPDC060132]|uniref:hypothetical protein n=1 Tax=unclassified Microbacterium TaxID=2609290 RepID=UPI0036482151
MTNPTNALAQIQKDKKPRWWNLLRGIIAGLVVALLLAILAPFLSQPSSAADLSNGAFCVKVTNDTEPDIFGMAGAKNCGEAEVPPVVTPPAPKPDLHLTSCTSRTDGLGRFHSLRVDWTSSQAAAQISATIDGQPIQQASITTTGPVAGAYSHLLTLDMAQLEALTGKTGGYSAKIRVDSRIGNEVSYGGVTFSMASLGMNPSCTLGL